MSDGMAAAYSATGAVWQRGPGPVYDRLAEVVVSLAPVPVRGGHVLDLGAGTGAVTRAALAAGASRVTAADVALGMLAHDSATRPPAAVADLRATPFAGMSFDAAIAAFSLNHLSDPAAGLREMVRVTRPGGSVVGASYSADDTHPVKAAVESTLTAHGWQSEQWHADFRKVQEMQRLSTVDGCRATLADADLRGDADVVHVPFPDLEVDDLVAWRLGMAQHAPFVASLGADEQRAVVHEAITLLGRQVPPLVRSIVVLSAIRP